MDIGSSVIVKNVDSGENKWLAQSSVTKWRKMAVRGGGRKSGGVALSLRISTGVAGVPESLPENIEKSPSRKPANGGGKAQCIRRGSGWKTGEMKVKTRESGVAAGVYPEMRRRNVNLSGSGENLLGPIEKRRRGISGAWRVMAWCVSVDLCTWRCVGNSKGMLRARAHRRDMRDGDAAGNIAAMLRRAYMVRALRQRRGGCGGGTA
jgi:hypothetical protein